MNTRQAMLPRGKNRTGYVYQGELDALLRVVRAAGKLIAIAPENDLYYALNKYCCEHMDEMIEALEALPDELCNTEE